MAGPLRRAGLFTGVVSDDEQPAGDYVRGELTRFQVKTIISYVVVAASLWTVGLANGRRTVLELAGFWSLLVVYMVVLAVRRARTPRSDEGD